MELQAIYDTKEEIPEMFQEFFSERNGKWELTGIKGIKTEADFTRMNEGLRKEREDHKATKAKLNVWGELEHEQIVKDQDELKEARIRLEKGGDGIDEEKLAKLVEARTATQVATQVSPIKRDLEKSQKENGELRDENGVFKTRETTRTITDSVRAAAVSSKVIDTAVEDVLMMAERVFEVQEDKSVTTRDGVGCTPGIDAATWLSEMQERRPHWWPSSTGGGSNGSGHGAAFAKNPFSAENWNLTDQGKAFIQDKAKATRMAQVAGTTIGGLKPAPITKTRAAG